MRIKIITVIFSIFLSLGLFGQDGHDYSIKEPVGISSINEAAAIAKEIVAAAGLKPNFIIAEANVPNALAILHQGKRYVLYNPGFVNKLTNATGTRWAAVSVLAHEIGHHLYNPFAGKLNKGLATELEADEFSGYVLENMGASLEEAQAAMNILATPFATRTHPARDDRIHSIAAGWQQAGGVVTETMREDVTNAEQVRSRDNRDHDISIPTSFFLARLQFNNAPGEDIYITKRLNIVKVENDEMQMLGRLDQSNDKNYPFIISDADGYRLYISSGGQIVNAAGHVLGKISKV